MLSDLSQLSLEEELVRVVGHLGDLDVELRDELVGQVDGRLLVGGVVGVEGHLRREVLLDPRRQVQPHLQREAVPVDLLDLLEQLLGELLRLVPQHRVAAPVGVAVVARLCFEMEGRKT